MTSGGCEAVHSVIKHQFIATIRSCTLANQLLVPAIKGLAYNSTATLRPDTSTKFAKEHN